MSRVAPPITKITTTLTRPMSTIHRNRALQYVSLSVNQSQISILESTKLELSTPPNRSYKTRTSRPIPRKPTGHVAHRPLMQGFRTSAPRPILFDENPIDFMFLPFLKPELLSSTAVRMPLTPDNFSPDRSQGSGLEAEVLDGAKVDEIVAVIAGKPDRVFAPSTAVVGNEGLATMDHVVVSFLPTEVEEAPEMGMIRQIWGGLIQDLSTRMPKFT